MIARDRISKLTANLVLLGIGILFVLPLLWVLFASVNRTAGLRVELPTSPTFDNFKAVLQAGLNRLDLVSRQEFDVQAAVLRRTREKLEALEARLATLEGNKTNSDGVTK